MSNTTSLTITESDVQRIKYRAIAALLTEHYGFPTWRQHLPPVEELVNCILSQSTNDANRDRAYDLLCATFPTWESLRDAPTDAVINAIRPAGLAAQKGPRIQNVLRQITLEHGQITLDFLRDMPLEAAKQWLTSLPGVGPKTAAIVLLFALDRSALPVDTHVHRVTQRLGLIGPKTTADKAHAALEAIIPPEDYYPAHLNLIRHGRMICQARRPRCEQCFLTEWCDYYQRTSKKDAT